MDDKKMDVAIIIVAGNSEKGLLLTIHSLMQQKHVNLCLYVIKNKASNQLKATLTSLTCDITMIDPNGKTIGCIYNELLTNIKTPYVMFMDAYDELNHTFIPKGIQTLNTHPEVAFAAGKCFWKHPLGTQQKVQHILSKLYIEGKGVYDLFTQYEALVTNLNGCVFRTEAVKEIGFNEIIALEAGSDLILRLILKTKTYAIIPKVTYYYHAARENQVLYHMHAHDKRWYEESIRTFLLPLLADAKQQYGEIPAFLQNYCVYYMNCRIVSNRDNRNKKVLLGDDLTDYLQTVQQLFSYIDDYYLLNQDEIPYLNKNPEIRCMYLRMKYGIDQVKYHYIVTDTDEGKDIEMRFHENFITSLSAHRFSINVMNYFHNEIWIDGSLINVFQYGDIQYYADFNGKKYPVEDTDTYSLTKYFGVPGYRRLTYHLALPLDQQKNIQKIRFFAKINGEHIQMKISFANHWSKLSKTPRYSYWRFHTYLCHHADNSILIKKATTLNVLKREIQLQLNLVKNHKRKDFNALAFRWLYWITYRHFKKQKIWLLLDKLYKGGDSAEYLYRYSANIHDGISRYYLINKNTSDYKKLVDDGFHPLINGTLKHKLVFVHADIILITNSHLFPFNGYNKATSKYIRGLCNFSSMCLQHGLSVQKCAMAQRRIIDNTMMYFLASKHELQNLSKHAYGYHEFDILKLTGIARYDGLISNDKKQILLSPTWRMYNALPVTTSEGEQRGYNPAFKHTTYFKVYNQLINNEKLIEAAKQYGYKIKFLLHPILSSQMNDFTPNSELEVIPSVGDLSYEKILTESSLMVTDYSGVQFDFAYMRKPIVYFHPDVLPPHYDDGIFFYDTMGFGEICTKSEQLVNVLCEYMKNECKMKAEYKKRADDFFVHDDHQNCNRIYQEIMKFQTEIDIDKLRNN